MKEQKRDGQIRNTGSRKVRRLQNPLVARLAGNQILQSFIPIRTVKGPIKYAANVINLHVRKDGTHAPLWIAGPQETINTVLRNNTLLSYMKVKTECVQYVAKDQKRKEGCMLIIAMIRAGFAGFFATVATRVLGHYEKALRFLPKHSVI